MIIRKTTPTDLLVVLAIYAKAREFMSENGNPTQWKDYYPPAEMIENDIADRHGYVCENEGEVVAVFYYNIENDATYEYIEGAWQNDANYGVVHRIAVKQGSKGIGGVCLNWAFEQCGNLKIDTHEDNIPMRRLLDKLGFVYCGKIRVLEGTEERIAFQKTREEMKMKSKIQESTTDRL
ncbi:acetyltransferase [Clostridia bacterium]|nr:acetyltransferase [Clostridia bacterium]